MSQCQRARVSLCQRVSVCLGVSVCLSAYLRESDQRARAVRPVSLATLLKGIRIGRGGVAHPKHRRRTQKWVTTDAIHPSLHFLTTQWPKHIIQNSAPELRHLEQSITITRIHPAWRKKNSKAISFFISNHCSFFLLIMSLFSSLSGICLIRRLIGRLKGTRS